MSNTETLKIKIDSTDATSAAAALDKLAKSGVGAAQNTQAIAQASKAQAAAIDRQVQSLNLQAVSLGKSASATKLLELQMKGATAAQLATAKASLQAADAYSAAQKKLNDGYALGQKIGDALKLGALAGAAGLATLVTTQANAIDRFNDLSAASGSTVENISALDSIARRTGASFDTVEGALLKFNSQLANSKPGSDFANVLKQLGLNADDLKKMDPAEALRTTAEALNGFADNGTKARNVQELFGKSTRDVAKFLKDLGEQTTLVAKTTTDQAQAINAYNDELSKLKANSEDAARSLTTKLVPALTRVLAAYNSGLGFADKFKRGLDGFGEEVGLGAAFHERRAIDQQKDRLADLQAGQRSGSIFINNDKEIQQLTADIGKAEKAYYRLSNFSGPGRGTVFPPFVKPSLDEPTKKGREKTGPKDDPTNALLANALKEIERQNTAEQALLQSRNRFIDLYNDQNLLSIHDYYEARRVAQKEATDVESAGFDAEIAALRKYQKTANQRDFATAEGKVQEAVAKKAALQQKVGEDSIYLAERERIAQATLARQFDDINTTLLELRGNLAAAAAIRFDDGNRELLLKATKEGNTAAIANLAILRAQTVAQARYNEQTTTASDAIARLQIAESRIDMARQGGAVTEFGALAKVGEARRATLAQMQSIVEAQEAIAKASEDPRLKLAAEQARLEFDKLAATLDPLGDKIRGVFTDAGTTAIESFLNGSKSGKAAIADFAKDISQQLNRSIAQSLSESLFGKGGTFGDVIGKAANSIFGGSGAGGISSLSSSAVTGAGALDALTAAANSAALSLGGRASSTGSESGGGGILGSIIGAAASYFGGSSYSASGDASGALFSQSGEQIRGRRETGGTVSAGGLYQVNERGPELLQMANGSQYLMMGAQGGTVKPQATQPSQRNVTVHVHQAFAAGATQQTTGQAAASAGREVQRALSRGNA